MQCKTEESVFMLVLKQNYSYAETEEGYEIYMPGGDGYFRYTLKHIVKPYTDGGTHQNQDLYRLHNLYLCRKTENGFENIYDFPLTTTGEWECAFKIEDTPDFHGGFHGYEHQKDFCVTPHEDSFEVTQSSEIYLQGTRDELVALHQKHYRFREGTLFLHQSLLWKRPVRINRAFLTMLPIRRLEGDFQITDTVLFRGETFDVSCAGHQTKVSSGSREIGSEITVLGRKSGILATVTSSPEKRVSIQNTPAYNKVYYYYTSDSEVKEGDLWEMDSTYRFEYTDPRG